MPADGASSATVAGDVRRSTPDCDTLQFFGLLQHFATFPQPRSAAPPKQGRADAACRITVDSDVAIAVAPFRCRLSFVVVAGYGRGALVFGELLSSASNFKLKSVGPAWPQLKPSANATLRLAATQLDHTSIDSRMRTKL